VIFDCEGNSLTPTKFHVLSYEDEDNNIKSLTSYDDMREWLLSQKVLIGHRIIQWDIPNLERVLKIKIKAKLIDTLALSWYLSPEKKQHGLEMWGEYFHIPKPPVIDWENEPLEVYVHRCNTDVDINRKLFTYQKGLLSKLYETEDPTTLPIISYLSWKMDCAREQEEVGWRLDRDQCEKNLDKLLKIKEEKEKELIPLMPKVEKLGARVPPAKPFTKAGDLSASGRNWKALTSERNLPFEHREPIHVVLGYEEPNPSSPDQIKSWLFSLGWEPDLYKEIKENGEIVRKVPQIKKTNSPDLCDSIISMFDDHPQLFVLEGLSAVNHRIGLLKGFLRDADENNILKAEIQGLTNTLRFKHTTIVNLPGTDKLYGREVRECLIPDEDCVLVGSDAVALEDLTKRHFMYEYDPDYVNEMSEDGFDPHLDLARVAGALSSEQIAAHKDGKEDHGKLRKVYKVVNYSATYGIGKAKLARDLKASVAFAGDLLQTYWTRNWSIKEIAANTKIKTIKGSMWLLNPVSGFWYSLRYEKDIFSTLNQGTGVFCFDNWVREVRRYRKITAQFHDEIIIKVGKDDVEVTKNILQKAITAVNNKLKLNIKLKVDTKSGGNYADIH